MYDAASAEDLGKPSATFCNEGFLTDARLAAARKGISNLRLISETIPSEGSVPEQIESGVDAVIEDLILALTRPLTAEEQQPKVKVRQTPPRITFKGTLAETNRFFYRRGWTDGLPIIPPTEEAVAEMLTGTDLPADHVVGKLVHRMGKATIEKIAINAVMAGALPTYMPVLIAAVEALLDEKGEFSLFGVSTGSWTPFWIINGPVRNDLHVESGSGALSPGNIANATIGRALGLIIMNIGGARKGLEDMGVIGNPMKYSMVLAEAEENSLWEPLHVQYGFDKEESTITLSFPNTFIQPWPYGSDDKGILNCVLSNMMPRSGPFCLILPPTQAKILAQSGWTKPQLARFIAEHARVPGYKHPNFYGVSAGVVKKELLPIGPMDVTGIIDSPDLIRIVVAGGPGSYIGITVGYSMGETEWVTKKIRLPANWDQLVRKYGSIVPTYERH